MTFTESTTTEPVVRDALSAGITHHTHQGENTHA